MPLEGWVATAHEAQRFGTSKESSARQTSFTKLSADVVCENGDVLTNVSAISDRDEALMGAVIPTLSRSQKTSAESKDSDAESHEELCDKTEAAEVLQDARLDHPTSALEVQYNNEDDSNFRDTTGHGSVEHNEDFEKSHNYFRHTAGPGSVEPDEDYGESNVDKTDQEGSVDFEKSKGKEVLYRDTQTAPSESEFENVSNRIFDTGEWSSERQRPT